MAIGDEGDRPLIFLGVLSNNYGPVWIIALVMFFFVAILTWQAFNKSKEAILPLMLWSGAFTYFLYIGIASTMMPRYFWIGAALITFALGATLIIIDTRMRWLVIGLLVSCFGFHVYSNLDGLVKWGC